MNKNTTKALGLATATAVLAGGVAATNTVAHADDVKESAQSTTADQTSTATQTKEQAQAAVDAQKQANTDVENANKTIADVKAATDNTQRDADRAAAQQKVDDQQKVVDQAKAAVDAAADPDAAYNKAVSDAQTAHDNTIKTATDAQSQAQRAADAADAAVTNANKDVPRQAQGGDDKGSFYPSDWPSTMFVHNLAELPTTVNDPFTGGDDAATRQTIHAMLYYQDNGTDTSEHVINGQITEAQFNTLQSYFISLVNGYRTAHGLGTISATTEGKAFSDYITNLRNSLNMGYNHTDMFDIHTGAPLDFNKDRAKVTESDHAIETAANQSGFHNSSEVQGLLQQSTANVGYRTMADLMTGVYQVVSSMLYDDGMAIWGHRTALSDPDIKFAALTINPTHDADSNKLYKGYNYDIQLETLTPVNGKSVSDFHTLDNNIAFNLINTTRATYGASADQLKAQTDAHTALDAAKQHVTDVTNSADATLASAKADALQVKNAAGTNIDTLKGTLATAQSTLTNL
ncbi:hypothetical protein R55227_BLOPHJLP_00654 [Fructobacillus tropaeoli]|uniref:SEC10/PgrA surface exclusion domain-containing protein n=1 Tax=Fructobacillus tropaeoli TaxID=709323 RepID=UPI002D998919|nr:hypothetical protein R55227_BLOPHJLP_00654 [Fructobacillus tropaeoli]